MNDAITNITIQCCDDFPNAPIYKMHGFDVRLRRTRGRLCCRSPKEEATFRVRRTVHISKLTSFMLSIKFNMPSAFTFLIEARCIVDKHKPPENLVQRCHIEHLLFLRKIHGKARSEMCQTLSTSEPL